MPYFKTTSGFIFANLPKAGTDPYYLFEIAESKLKHPNNSILYLPEQEYNLVSKGFGIENLKKGKMTNEQKKKMVEILGVDYMINTELILLNSEGGILGVYGYESNYSPQGMIANSQIDINKKAKIRFSIISLLQNGSDHQFTVETSISGLIVKESNYEMHHVNIASKSMALKKAFRKGIKQIEKHLIDYSE